MPKSVGKVEQGVAGWATGNYCITNAAENIQRG
jgi:hypothetical protein